MQGTLENKPVKATSKITKRYRSLDDLQLGSLYLALFTRPHVPGTFHWALYYYTDPQKGGWKMHVINMGSTGNTWTAGHTFTAGIFKELSLVGLMHVASPGLSPMEELLRSLREDDDNLNQVEGLTCRVWIARACERLRAKDFMRFPEWDVLEKEAIAWGLSQWEDCDRNVQPRSLVVSAVCTP